MKLVKIVTTPTTNIANNAVVDNNQIEEKVCDLLMDVFVLFDVKRNELRKSNLMHISLYDDVIVGTGDDCYKAGTHYKILNMRSISGEDAIEVVKNNIESDDLEKDLWNQSTGCPPVKLKLVQWADDRFPPIDLNKHIGSVAELINEYKKLQEENKTLTELIVEIRKGLEKMKK